MVVPCVGFNFIPSSEKSVAQTRGRKGGAAKKEGKTEETRVGRLRSRWFRSLPLPPALKDELDYLRLD